MTTFYSQHGEDVLLNEIFKRQSDGFFVEVGCIDGVRFSNTYLLEQRGWKGMCVEAHGGYIDVLKKNRPNSIVCHCAAGEKNEDNVSFYANARGSLSSLNREKETYFGQKFGKYFTGYEEQRVEKRRLDTLFREYCVGEIDVLSLDIEGYEVEALMGIDLSVYRPWVMVIESDSPNHENELDKILLSCNYHKSLRLGGNLFYFADPSVETKIKEKVFDVKLAHTGNPFFEESDVFINARISTRRGFLRLVDRVVSKLIGRRVFLGKDVS